MFGWLLGASLALVTVVGMLYGFAALRGSPMSSTAITEVVERVSRGAALACARSPATRRARSPPCCSARCSTSKAPFERVRAAIDRGALIVYRPTTMNDPPARDYRKVAGLARALGHPARVRIVQTLLEKQACIGCDLVDETGLAQSTVSEHLRILKVAGIITGEIERPRVCYSLNPSALEPLRRFLFIATRRGTARTSRRT